MRSRAIHLGTLLIVFVCAHLSYGRLPVDVEQVYAQSPGSLPRVQQSNLVYQGAFLVPRGSTTQTSFSYGGPLLPITLRRSPFSW